MMTARHAGALALVLGITAGCTDDGVRRYELSGTVTYAGGKPVPTGTLSFEPDTSKGCRGPGSFVDIENGRYRIAASKGVVGGPYIIRILGYDGKGDERGESLKGRTLFPEQVQTVDLPHADGAHNIVVVTR